MSQACEILSFAEGSCWKGEQLRPIRREVVFVVSGPAFRKEIVADHGVWYDQDNIILLERLTEADPSVEWDSMIVFRLLDQSAIQLLSPDDGTVQYVVRVRSRARRVLPTENLGANVITWQRVQAHREKMRERERESQGEDTPAH